MTSRHRIGVRNGREPQVNSGSLAIFTHSDAAALEEDSVAPIGSFDDLFERRRGLVETRHESWTLPLVAAVSPAVVRILDEVVGRVSVLDVIGGVGLHFCSIWIGFREHVFEVGRPDACDDLDFFVGRNFSPPISVLVGVDDDSELVSLSGIRCRQEWDPECRRELGLVATDVGIRLPGGSGVPAVSVLCHCMPFGFRVW